MTAALRVATGFSSPNSLAGEEGSTSRARVVITLRANVVSTRHRCLGATLPGSSPRLKANDGRVDHVHAQTLDFRRALTDQLLKLNQMLERMKRREVEETERQAKELRMQQSQLKTEDE